MKQDLDLSILETLENLHAEWGGGAQSIQGQYLVSQSCAQEDQSADFSYISIMLKLGDMRIGNIWT